MASRSASAPDDFVRRLPGGRWTVVGAAFLAGWLLFAERIDSGTLLGASIILSATFYIAQREARLARTAASQAPSEAAKPGE